MRSKSLNIAGACVLLTAILAATAAPAAAGVASSAPVLSRSPHSAPLRAPRPRAVAGLPAWQVDVQLPPDLDQPNGEIPSGISFSDVEAVGPHDAWAVGTSGRFMQWWARPVVWHWHDGRWQAAAMPPWLDGSRVGGWVNQLQAVGGSSPADVWTMGVYYLVTETIVRAVHWDGHRWTRFAVPSPRAPFGSPQINSLLSFGKKGAWAFGCSCDLTYSPGYAAPYIVRFRHGAWHNVTPHGLTSGAIWTAWGNTPSDIWAVMTDPNTGSTTLLHWTGTSWHRLPVPRFGSARHPVFFSGGGGIVTTSDGAVWLAGTASTGAAAIARQRNGHWALTTLPVTGQLGPLVPDGKGGFWSALNGTPSEIWHYASGHWSRAADPLGISGSYFITWMAHVPGGLTSLAIGGDQQYELLLHG